MWMWMIACAEPTECTTGFERHSDGNCYAWEDDDGDPILPDADTDPEEEADPTVEDLLDALPDCEPAATDGRLDLLSGCADGVCVQTTYADAVALLGEAACETYVYEQDTWLESSVECRWDNGIGAEYDDLDRDGLADVGATTFSIEADATFTGGTTNGLGIGASLRCFTEQFGDPSYISFTNPEGRWSIQYIGWSEYGIYAYDFYDRWGDYGGDGKVDGLTMYGSY